MQILGRIGKAKSSKPFDEDALDKQFKELIDLFSNTLVVKFESRIIQLLEDEWEYLKFLGISFFK